MSDAAVMHVCKTLCIVCSSVLYLLIIACTCSLDCILMAPAPLYRLHAFLEFEICVRDLCACESCGEHCSRTSRLSIEKIPVRRAISYTASKKKNGVR